MSKSKSNILDKLKSVVREVWAHMLTLLAMIPLLVAIWIAFPTLNFEFNGQEYLVTGYQPFESNSDDPGYERVGFKESLDLQGGMSFRVEIIEPEEEEQDGSTVLDLNDGTGDVNLPASIGNSGLELPQLQQVDPVERTIQIIRERLDAMQPIKSEMYRLENEEGNTELLINLSMSREEAAVIPFYLTSKGDISIWVDDPTYEQPEDGSDQFNFYAGRQITSITRNDIESVVSINDPQTIGIGLKVDFVSEAVPKVDQASTQIGSNVDLGPQGFMLVLDGQPVALQSAAYLPSNQTLSSDAVLYFSVNQADKEEFQALAATMNTDLLPTETRVVTGTNSNINPEINTNLDTMKVILFATFLLSSVIMIFAFKSYSIFNLILNLNTLVIAIAILKIFRQTLSVDLIIGVVLGLTVTIFLGVYTLKVLLSDPKSNTIEFVKKKRREISNRALALGFILLMWTILISIFGTVFTYQLTWGFGVTIIASFITLLTIFPTFIRELFILPLKPNVR